MSDIPWKVEPTWLRNLANAVVKVPPAIIVEPRLRVQKSFPKSKRRRVRNENYKVDRNIYQVGGRYLCHPSVALELRALLRAQGYTMMDEVTT